MEPEYVSCEPGSSAKRSKPLGRDARRFNIGDLILLFSLEGSGLAVWNSGRAKNAKFLGALICDSAKQLGKELLLRDFKNCCEHWQKFAKADVRRKETALSQNAEQCDFGILSVGPLFVASGHHVFGKASFRGAQLQKVTRLNSLSLLNLVPGSWYARGANVPSPATFQEFVQRIKFSNCKAVMLPEGVATAAFAARAPHGRCCILPVSMCDSLGLALETAYEANEALPACPAEASDAVPGRPGASLLVRPRHDAALHVFYACLGHYVQNLEDIEEIIGMVGSTFLPALGLEPVVNIAVPERKTLSLSMVKLDLLHTLSCRVFNRAGEPQKRRARYLGSDSSPQGGFDYFAIVEDVLERPASLEHCQKSEEDFDAFGGFFWKRRTLPLTTLARGQGSASMKFSRLLHVLHQEQGAGNIDNYRSEVKGYLSDQGTERHLFDFPYEKSATLNNLSRGLLSGEVSLEDVGHVPFLSNAFGIPGVMHILFNALESSLKTSDMWAAYEVELRAVGKIFSQKSYVDLVLHFTQNLSATEKQLIRSLDVAVLDWRWESIEYCAKYWKEVGPILKDKWHEGSLGDSEKKLAANIQAALASDTNRAMTLWTCVMSGAVGACSRWLEGCFCHEKEASFRQSRARVAKRLLERDTDLSRPGTLCPWKGKRLCVLAWDGPQQFLDILARADTEDMNQAFLHFDRALVNSILRTDGLVRQNLQAVLRDKFSWCQKLPFKVAGVFRLYVDKTLPQAIEFAASCFRDYAEAVSSGATMDPISVFLLGKQSAESQQLSQFARQDITASDLRSLREFPLAFTEVQERAWCPMAERFLESQHRGIKWAFRRGFTKASPPVTCARQRRSQVLPMVTDSGAQKAYVMKNWSRKGLWVDLLGHVMSPAEIALLTVPQKLARCYCYAEADHFQDTAEQEVSVAAFRAALRDVQKTDEEPKPGHKQWISFLKQQLSNGTLCSFPEAIFSKLADEDAAMREEEDLDEDDDLNDQVLQEAFGGDEVVLADLASGNVVYCQVVRGCSTAEKRGGSCGRR